MPKKVEDANPPLQVPGGRQLDFPELMERVRSVLGAHFSAPELKGDFKKVEQEFETVYRKVERPTVGLQKDSAILSRELDRIYDLLDKARKPADTSTSANPPAVFIHPLVRLLLWLNFEYAKRVGGVAAAEAELVGIVKGWTKKRRGAPPKLAMGQLQEIKRLRDEGLSFAQIGKQLGLSGSQVRTALQHHYPEKKSS